jgi:alcohol dehydrogenase
MQTRFYSPGTLNNFYSPNKIILSNGAASVVGIEAKALGSKKAMVVTDQGMVKTGSVELIKEYLKAQGIETVVYDKVEPETPVGVIEDAAQRARSERCDVIIALGGGTTLDTVKGVSLMAVNAGVVLDYEGIDRVPLKGLPKIMIPTTAGSGSEVTRVFGITDQKNRTKGIVYTLYNLADVVILDPALTLSLPPGLTADTGMDVLVHAVEAYTSATATPFSDMLALEAIRLVGRDLPAAYAKGENLEARFNMLMAASMAGLAFSSAGLGAVHGLAFELETKHGVSHARAAAVMLPHVMDFNRIAAPQKFASIARALGEDVGRAPDHEGAIEAVTAVLRILKDLNISCRLSDYGITDSDVPDMAEGASRQVRLFSQNARNVGKQDVIDIYMKGLR